MKAKLLLMLKVKEDRKLALAAQALASADIAQVKAINIELEALNGDIAEVKAMLAEIKEDAPAPTVIPTAPVQLSAGPVGPVTMLAAYGLGSPAPEVLDAAKRFEAAEARGKALLEKHSVTVGSSDILLPAHQATDIRPTFNLVSGLIDRVDRKILIGGESFKQPYMVGYGTGDYTEEEDEFATAEPTFAYADINKAKVTAWAEDSEEVLRLPAAAYDAEVQKGIRLAGRRKITREILIGDGATNHLVGIFDTAAEAIDIATDLELSTIDVDTLTAIVFSFGGDEEVEDAAVLILNKLDLKAFAQLRTDGGDKAHTIVSNGNAGTIDGIPFLINSVCHALTHEDTDPGDYCMAYGPPTNYLLAIFSDTDIQRSTDYKFKEAVICHRGSTFVGGNVVSQNGFLRVKMANGA